MRFRVSIALIFFSLLAKAQDPHFSQFYVSPLLQNPANTGYFNCDYRITAIYKSQWNSVTVPYSTFAGSYDMRFLTPHAGKGISHSNDFLGAGIVFSNDEAGDGSFNRPYFGVAGSYHKILDRYSRSSIGGGLMLAYGAGTIDFNKLTFDDQYPPFSNGPLNPTNETPFHSFGYFDLSAGATYDLIFIDKDKHYQDKHFQIGAAVFHINSPQESFLGNSDSRLPPKFVFHTSFQLRLNNKIELFPKINVTYQGTSHEYMIGTFARVDLSNEKDYGVYIGSWVRVNDAVVAVMRFDVASLSFSFSYDINVSSLDKVSEGRGGPEFSLIYIGCLGKHPTKGLYCPRF